VPACAEKWPSRTAPRLAPEARIRLSTARLELSCGPWTARKKTPNPFSSPFFFGPFFFPKSSVSPDLVDVTFSLSPFLAHRRLQGRPDVLQVVESLARNPGKTRTKLKV
jgi:hypothetical protein